jgi:hypothetical protein
MALSHVMSTVGVALLSLSGTVGCNAVLNIDEATLCAGACDAGAEPFNRFQTASRADTDVDGAVSGRAALDAGAATRAAPTCATPAPDVARDCAACAGRVACDGRCDVDPPADLGRPCGSCGGTIGCNGACSAPTPPTFGDACGACGGAIDCSGNCSVATPSDYGSVLPRDTLASFSCCFVDEVRSYGPDGADSFGCYPGYVYDGCTVSKASGGGSVSIVGEDAAACTCRVRVANDGLEGATYTVHIRLKRGCSAE